jgi:NAD(P)-dependent dehydrogenase (short-subunit alcohol dehydrogenase family)
MSGNDYSRRRALVTGSSSGIGEAIARRLLSDGWEVAGFDRAPPTLEARRFTSIAVDLADASALAQAVAAERNVTALVHAAGCMRVAPLGELDAEEGVGMWRLHVQAATLLANAIAPHLPAGGRIVLIGSRTAAGAAERSQYAATKAALVGMARSWAIELAPRGITVNVIAPAATDTPMLHDRARGAVAPRTPPIGRFVRPEEVAALTAFVLSDDAAAITGQQLVICGGASL